MNCNETRFLIDADVDGELDLVRHLEIAAHLRTCAGCAGYAGQAKTRRSVLRDSLPRFIAPPQLAGRIRAALKTEGAPVPHRARVYWPLWNIAGVAASLAFALLVGIAWGNARARSNLLVDEAVNDHVRSLQANHLTDVATTDQHTVRPGRHEHPPRIVRTRDVPVCEHRDRHGRFDCGDRFFDFLPSQ